jgi:hypothetical protein
MIVQSPPKMKQKDLEDLEDLGPRVSYSFITNVRQQRK